MKAIININNKSVLLKNISSRFTLIIMQMNYRFGKAEKLKSIIFTSFGHFTNDFTFLLFSILIIYYNKNFGISLVILGAIAIISTIISGILSTPIGKYSDKTRKYTDLISIGFVILGFSFVAFAISFASVNYTLLFAVIAAVLLGVGLAFYHPLGASILNFTYKNKSSSMLGINGAFGSIGRAVMPILLIPLILVVGKVYALLIISAYMFIAAIVIYKGLFFLKICENPPKEKNKKSNIVPNTISKYRSVLFILVALVFIRAMFLIGTTTYISEYLIKELGTETQLSYILTISFITAVIGQPFFGKLTDKYGGKAIIWVTSILSAVFFILFMLSGPNVLLIIVNYSLFVFMAFSGFPVLLGYVGQIVPKEISTTANGMVWGIGNTIGGAIGIAVMILFLFMNVSLLQTMWIMVIFGILSIFLIPFIPNKKRSIELKLKSAQPFKNPG